MRNHAHRHFYSHSLSVLNINNWMPLLEEPLKKARRNSLRKYVSIVTSSTRACKAWKSLENLRIAFKYPHPIPKNKRSHHKRFQWLLLRHCGSGLKQKLNPESLQIPFTIAELESSFQLCSNSEPGEETILPGVTTSWMNSIPWVSEAISYKLAANCKMLLHTKRWRVLGRPSRGALS